MWSYIIFAIILFFILCFIGTCLSVLLQEPEAGIIAVVVGIIVYWLGSHIVGIIIGIIGIAGYIHAKSENSPEKIKETKKLKKPAGLAGNGGKAVGYSVGGAAGFAAVRAYRQRAGGNGNCGQRPYGGRHHHVFCQIRPQYRAFGKPGFGNNRAFNFNNAAGNCVGAAVTPKAAAW